MSGNKACETLYLIGGRTVLFASSVNIKYNKCVETDIGEEGGNLTNNSPENSFYFF